MRGTEYFKLVIGMASWATLYPLIKLLNGHVDPYLLALVRYGVASLILAGIVLHYSNSSMPQRKDWILCIVLGFLGALTTVFIALGVEHSTASASSILVNTNPLKIAILAPLMIHERTKFVQLAGVLLGIIGIVFVVFNGTVAALSGYGTGVAFLLGAAFCQALYAMYMKPLVKQYGALMTTTTMAVMGFFELLVIVLLNGRLKQAFLFSAQQWQVLFLIGAVSTALGSYLWIQSLGRLSATASTSFKLLIPVFATLYGVFFLGEQLTPWIVGGMLLTTAGILLAQPKFLDRFMEL